MNRAVRLRDITELSSTIASDPLGSIASAAAKRKKLIAAFALLGLLLATAAGFYIPPSYEAAAYLIVGKSWLEKDQGSGERREGALNTDVQIAKSHRVIRSAVEEFGVQELYPSIERPAVENATKQDAAVARVAQAYSVRAEKGSNVLKISFRHSDRIKAAAFVNLLAEEVVTLENDLGRRSGATEMLLQLKQRHVDAVRSISAELSAFSVANNVYSVNDQRAVLLGRESSVKANIVVIESSIAEKQAEASSLGKQLALLKISRNNRTLANTIEILGKTTKRPDGASANGKRHELNSSTSEPTGFDTVGGDPPILLVKVYQESIQAMVKVNAEYDGLVASLETQKSALSAVQNELVKLAENEAKFHELTREASIAKTNVEAIGRRLADQQLQDEVKLASMSGVTVFQKAEPPLAPFWPRLSILIPIGLVAGALLGFLLALKFESSLRRTKPR